ncbi:MAG: hypothetical protein PHS57_09135 [Alphaproteobacteria bacterium]|nr:hypothetical protein [Alphaproteobacteria bacterium]
MINSCLFDAGFCSAPWSFLGDSLSPALSFARASGGARFNASGALETVSADAPRFSHDLLTQSLRGLLIEPQRTNAIGNSTMQGASASPSTLPTGWVNGSAGGLTRTIVGVGTEYGMPYVDIRVNGTSVGTQNVTYFDETISAARYETWSAHFYIKLVEGGANVSGWQAVFDEYTSAPAWTASHSSATIPLSSSPVKVTLTEALVSSSCYTVHPGIRVVLAGSGLAVDHTFRLYAPQMEEGASATSFIATETAPATRAADALSFTVPAGVTALRYRFDDNSTQDVAVSPGAYTVPTTLGRPWIRTVRFL